MEADYKNLGLLNESYAPKIELLFKKPWVTFIQKPQAPFWWEVRGHIPSVLPINTALGSLQCLNVTNVYNETHRI